MSSTQKKQEPITNDLEGQTALVTGATSGIGRATAKVLAAHGARVVVHGRDAGRGAATVADIQSNGGIARLVKADLRNPVEIVALANEAGDIDILINNAGFMWFGASADMSLDDLALLFESNMRSAFLLTAQVAPAMAARGSGSIVNLGSLGGHIGLAAGAAYGASKAAIHSLTRAWAAEFSAQGVRVNAVAPGPVQPESGSDPVVDEIARSTLLRRPAHAKEIAEVIAFLAGPRASYITGAIIPVDGGRTAI
jgi:NAD(P)-dependent dehydrogenase (short-subunit alcohol dehydrogenase family)